jgi:hypothetical protein
MNLDNEKYPKVSKVFDLEFLYSELDDFLINLLLQNDIEGDNSKIISMKLELLERNIVV